MRAHRLSPSLLEALLNLMQVQPRDRILELECGQGEMSVALASRVPEGMVLAMDASPDRVQQARVRARDLDNVMFLLREAAAIPWKEGFFFKALSHGFPPDLQDVLRVLTPGGLLYLAPEPRPHSDDVSHEPAPREEWEQEWAGRLEAAGLGAIQAHHLPEDCTVLMGEKPA